LIERINVGKHNVAIFATGLKESSRLLVAIELEVFWRLRKAENIDCVIFESLIIEQLDIWRIIERLDVGRVVFGVPMAVARKDIMILRIGTVKIVVTKRNENWCNLAELFEPGSEAFEIGGATDIVELID
jgi:hypothetical protein